VVAGGVQAVGDAAHLELVLAGTLLQTILAICSLFRR